MTFGHYILDENLQVVKADLLEWARWFETANRIVARYERDWVMVSTVFLGLDHNYSPHGPPLLFETMVFGGALNEQMMRYSTWAQAEAGHAEMVKRVDRAFEIAREHADRQQNSQKNIL